MSRWRVERAKAGDGWMTIDPAGNGSLWGSWRTAYLYALACAGGQP